jgi:mannose-6-phosphate isomerase-like protein (cupin superfamily)
LLKVLEDLAANYARVKPQDYVGSINVEIGENLFTLVFERDDVSVREGRSDKVLVDLVMSEETFGKLVDGTWNGMTAAGREHARQPAPLDFRFPPGQSLGGKVLQMLYHLGMHFFHRSYPHVFRFGPAHARTIHGGHAVPLAYGHGIRFAYYTISGSEQINEAEDSADPFDQVIAVIGGAGAAVIGGVEVALEKGVAVHVPPMTTHIIRARGGGPLELFWVAYGTGA